MSHGPIRSNRTRRLHGGKSKGAYDLYYHILDYRKRIEDIADTLKPMIQEAEVKGAL